MNILGSPTEQLRQAVRLVAEVVGCGDNSCLFEKPAGMATNGRCRCLERGPKPGLPWALAMLYKTAKAVVSREKGAPVQFACGGCQVIGVIGCDEDGCCAACGATLVPVDAEGRVVFAPPAPEGKAKT